MNSQSWSTESLTHPCAESAADKFLASSLWSHISIKAGTRLKNVEDCRAWQLSRIIKDNDFADVLEEHADTFKPISASCPNVVYI
eukprot:scaffold43718_cov43-Prasinocladus_malaysianus.AAC.1